MWLKRARYRAPLLVLIALTMVASGCGNRAEDDAASGSLQTGLDQEAGSAPQAADTGMAAEASPTPAAATGGAPADAAGVLPNGTGSAPRPADLADARSGRSPSAGGAATPNRSESPSAIAGGGPPPPGDAGASPHAGQGATPALPDKPSPGPAGPKSVVKLGSVAALSGPAGSNYLPMVEGGQMWAAWVNRRGGVNGHQVQIVVADDGGDPARHKAAVKNLVEHHGVIGLIALFAGTVGPVAREYVEAKRVPVFGDEGGADWAYESPMYFPQMPTGQELVNLDYASLSRLAIAKGKPKVAVVTCVEAQICKTHYDQADQQLGRRGVQLVYKAQGSFTQPDYTAECLAARNAGTEVMLLVSEKNGLRRIVTSCARQGFRPLYVMASPGIGASLVEDENLDNTSFTPLQTFPWFQNNTKATAEFQSALKEFKVEGDYNRTFGWVSGKLFEKAAANLPEPATSEALLEGLWTIENDDLNGLTAPLTFKKGGNAKRVTCWIDVAIVDGKWTSPSGFKRACE